MDNERYYNHTPTSLEPRVTDLGQVVLRRVDGVGREGRADSTTVITKSFVVRAKHVPQILGEDNSMLRDISQVSGASLSLAVDMRNVLNGHVRINVWGLSEQVASAETLIFNLITQGYDDPPSFLPMVHDYVHQELKVLPIAKALRLLKERNIVRIEAASFSWIDVDFSKPWKEDTPRQVDVRIFGGNRKDIESAIAMIHEIVAQDEPIAEPEKKKGWAGRHICQCTKDTGVCILNGIKSIYNRMTKKSVHP